MRSGDREVGGTDTPPPDAPAPIADDHDREAKQIRLVRSRLFGLARLRQYPLFAATPSRELEKIPFKFKYEFHCDHWDCAGHSLSCTDWEICQSYRSWSRKYRDDWEGKLREKYEHEMIELNETHFYVGTLRGHPAAWIIVGLFYPRADN